VGGFHGGDDGLQFISGDIYLEARSIPKCEKRVIPRLKGRKFIA